MNPTNPRSVADHNRYEAEITTRFAQNNFWKLRDSLGHYFWSMAQEAIETNLNEGGNKKGRFSAIAAARKAEMQKAWKTQLERKRELKNYALSISMSSNFNTSAVGVGEAARRRQKYLALKKAFNPIIKVDDFLLHPLRLRKQNDNLSGCELYVFPKPIPKNMSLTLSAS